MQSQQISPLSADDRQNEPVHGVAGHTGYEHPLMATHTDLPSEVPEHGHRKPVLDVVKDKVTDKVKKLKSKIKKHKQGEHHESHEDTSGSEEEEVESPLQYHNQGDEQMVGGTGQGTPVIIRSLEGASLIPDPNVVSVGSGIGVHEAFGKPSLSGSEQLHEQVPSAAGQTSAGVTPYLAAHGFGGKAPKQQEDLDPKPLPENENALHATDSEGSEAIPGKVHGDKNRAEISNKVTSLESTHHAGETEKQEDKMKKEHADQGIAGDTVVGTGVKVKEDVSSKPVEKMSAEKKPMTSRAADTMISFKDALASKFGYGQKSSPKGDEVSPMETDVGERDVNVPPSHEKSYTEKLQETASEAKDKVVTGMHIAQETVIEAKDVLASKVGLHGIKEEANVGKSSDVLEQESEQEHSATAAAPRFHPGDEDRALSQLITEKLTLGATTLKDTLMRPFGSFKSKPSTPTSTAQPQPPSTASHVLSEEEHVTESEGEKQEQGLVGKAREAVSSMLAPVTSHPSTASHLGSEEEQVTQAGGDKEQQGVIGKVGETISSMLTPHGESEESRTTESGGGNQQQGMIGKASEIIHSMLGETPHAGAHEEKQAVESGGEEGQQGVIGRASEMIHSMLGETPKAEEEPESTSKPAETGVCNVEMH